jgi:hypothetical protein
MIVVKVELWSAQTGKKTPLAAFVVSNDGTGTDSHGNYDVKVLRKGSSDLDKPIRTGRVESHARHSLPVLTLIRRALEACRY